MKKFREIEDFWWVYKTNLNFNKKENERVWFISEGEGEISGNNYNKKIKKGDYFFMPSIAMGNFKMSGNIEIIECY